ncbi:hypothetical protein OHV13_34325 [Kitasatospora purpeofusca]|uniref:hypothetical protein n=1 Tax=Kitasatospora purpeofusca TaxID=67352 RepID=UPI0032522C6E
MSPLFEKGLVFRALLTVVVLPAAQEPLRDLTGGTRGKRRPAGWFLDNTRGFRRTLLMRRDGARLHADTPRGDLDRIRRKLDFLVGSGVPEQDARTAMPAAARSVASCRSRRTPDPVTVRACRPIWRRPTTSRRSRPASRSSSTAWRTAP